MSKTESESGNFLLVEDSDCRDYPSMATATQPALTVKTVNNGTTDHKAKPVNMFHPAVDYIKSVEAYFSESPVAYTKFLDILQAYHLEENKTADYETYVVRQVQELFKDAPKLLDGFALFSPPSSDDRGMASKK